MLSIDAGELNQLAVRLGDGALYSNVRRRTSAVIRKTAYDIEADAKRFCPVDTGNLRNSISTSITADLSAVSAEIGPTADYAAFVEYGTSRTAPQAFMGPAFDRHVGEAVAALGLVTDGVL